MSDTGGIPIKVLRPSVSGWTGDLLEWVANLTCFVPLTAVSNGNKVRVLKPCKSGDHRAEQSTMVGTKGVVV